MILPPLLASIALNWQRLALYAAIAAAALGIAWTHGYGKGSARLFEYRAEQAEARVALVVRQAAATERVVTRWRTRDRIIEKQGDTIIKEVPVYVTRQDDDRCGPVPDGFVSLWNRANRGLPDPAGGTPDPAHRPPSP